VLTKVRFLSDRLFTGTLARMTLGGTAPREVLEGVRQADWSPDGTELAIIRTWNGKDRLEYPIGTVLYETAGYLTDPRVSSRGDRIALFEHQRRWDDRGSVVVFDGAGKRTLLSDGYWGEQGLAWSGDEVLFTASTLGVAQTLYGVDLSGHRRVALASAGSLTMHDIARTGHWLVTRDDRHTGICVKAPGSGSERDLSWLDWSDGGYLSGDGRMLLFTNASASSGPNYAVCLRTSEGGPVVRLGEGSALGLSPDGKWALTIVSAPPQVVLYPTGPGEARRLERGPLAFYQFASWFPDGRSVLVCGNEAGKSARCYQQTVSGGPPRPITPDAAARARAWASPDGLRILYNTADGSWFMKTTAGGTAEPVPGLSAGDGVIRWSADGRSIYVDNASELPFRIERLDLASGRRVVLHRVAPADRTGIFDGSARGLADDEQSYAYSYQRMTSHLFVVEGAR
jgi:Tol biopolymer transport system component